MADVGAAANLPPTLQGTIRGQYTFWGFKTDQTTDLSHVTAHYAEAFIKATLNEKTRNTYTPTQTVQCFTGNLFGEAERWWNSEVLAPFRTDEAGKAALEANWDAVLLKFKAKYFKLATDDQLSIEFTRCVQKPGEHPSFFALDVVTMVLKWADLRPCPIAAAAPMLPANFFDATNCDVANQTDELKTKIRNALHTKDKQRWKETINSDAVSIALKIILGGIKDSRIRDKLYAWPNKTPSTEELLQFIRKEEQVMEKYNPALRQQSNTMNRRNNQTTSANTKVNAVYEEETEQDGDEDQEENVAAWSTAQGKGKKKKKKAQGQQNAGGQQNAQQQSNNQVPSGLFGNNRAPGATYAAAASTQPGRTRGNPNEKCSFCGRIGHLVEVCRAIAKYSNQAKNEIEEKKKSWAQKAQTDNAAGITTSNAAGNYRDPGNF